MMIDKETVIKELNDFADSLTVIGGSYIRSAIRVVIDPMNESPEMNDTISRQTAIDAYVMKCPYFSGKKSIDRSKYGTHIGSCDLEYHYKKICPSHECICAERLGLKNG